MLAKQDVFINKAGETYFEITADEHERQLAEAREDAIEVMMTYKQEIEVQKTRMNASHNGFVRTCCRQTIDQLKAEKDAIEMEVVG